MSERHYKRGMLRVGTKCPTPDADGYCDCEYDGHHARLAGLANLPHSCGEWIIGDREAVLDLIRDLEEALRQVKP